MNVQPIPQFSHSEIETLGNLKDKILSGVHYHYWKNFAKEDDSFSILLAVDLLFEDAEKLTLSSGESADEPRIVLNGFDIENERKLVKEHFKNQVEIQTSDEKQSDLWKQLIGKPVNKIELETIQYNENPMASHFKLNIGEEHLLVRTGLEGDGIHIEIIVDDE